MEGRLSLESLSKEDLDEVAELLGLVGGPTTRDYLRWKYAETPANQLSVAKDLNTAHVAGFNALTPWPVTFNGHVHQAVQSVDMIVHPQDRRRGIMISIGQRNYLTAKDNGFIIASGWATYGSPAHKGFSKLGWVTLGRMPEFLYPIKPFRAVRWLEWGRLKSLIAGVFLWLRKLVKHPKNVESDSLVLDKGTWDYEGLWRCWKESLKPGAAAVNRTPEFYRQRFSKSMWPPHEFIPISVRENGKIVCFAICITYPMQWGAIGIVVDLHCMNGKTEALLLLVSAFVNHFKAEGTDYVRLWGKKPKLIRTGVRKSGFIYNEGKACFVLRALVDEAFIPKSIMDFDVWDLDICDSDHV